MAEEIYFIKTNPNIAKINLYNKLCSEEETVLNFLDEDRKTSFEIIKTKVKDSIENLSPEEFRSIIHWFENEYKDTNSDQNNNEEVINQLYVHGIDQFYDIPPPNVKNFSQILADYQDHSQNSLSYKSNAENLSPFLIYGLFFTGLVSQFYQKENPNLLLMDFLKTEHKTIYSFAEDKFDSGLKNSENQFIDYSEPILHQYFAELYDLTRFYKGPIIKLDDY